MISIAELNSKFPDKDVRHGFEEPKKGLFKRN